MEVVIEFLKNISEYVVALEAMLLAMIVFFLLIPGDQPEKFFQKIVDLLKKISNK